MRSNRISREPFEAPNWTKDNYLLFNDGGGLYRIPVDGSQAPERVITGSLNRLNNDHGVSADGKLLAISDSTRPGGSRIYSMSMEGGEPKLLTEKAPSYWHGWSLDGKVIAKTSNFTDFNDEIAH